MKKFIALILPLLLIGCSENSSQMEKITVDSGFSNYVSAFTSGVVSNRDNIKVILVQPHPSAEAGAVVSEKVLSFDPSLDGEAYWLDSQTIEYRPTERLESGKAYTAHFALNKLQEVPSEFEEMTFGFMVMHQSIFVTYDGMRPSDLSDFSQQEIFGSVRTSDVVSPSELEKCFSASQGGTDLDIHWEHSEDAKNHNYTITNIKRSDSKSEVSIEWDGEAIGSKVEDEMEIRVPPLGEFSVLQVSTVTEPGLHFSIQLSDPVDVNQDLAGLVYLESGRKLRLTKSHNEIRAYPLDKLSSEETIHVNRGILNTRGDNLKSEFQKVVQFNLEKPSLELVGEGIIMPSDGQLTFPFKAINLKAVNVRVLRIYENNINQFFQNNQYNGSSNLSRVGRLVYDDVVDLVSTEAIDYGVWNHFKLDLNSLIDPEPGAIYRVMMSFERYQSLYPCGDSTGVVKPLKRRDLNYDSNEYYFDVDAWFEGWADYSERENPCSDSYYKYYKRWKSRNVFASNFGIIAKQTSNNQFDVVVTDLRSAEPLSGVTVEAYNYQNQFLSSGSTNGDGITRFDAGNKPYLLVAKKGDQRGYLRVDDGSSLSVSLYEVGGTSVRKGVKGFIYGERGVWRPGDTLFLSFVLEDKLDALPETHPVIMELYDPSGKLYEKKVSTSGVKGMYAFPFVTNDQSPTGRWMAKAIVGNSEFSKSLKIETVKPNRLKIDLDFPEVVTASSSLSTTLSAKWLYGSPGSGLKARVEMDVRNMKTVFEGYQDYQFDDRSLRFWPRDPVVAEGTTTGDGDVSLSFKWSRPERAPGMLKMSFNTKVFEQGGDFSQDFHSVKYSPYSSYVGIKLPGGRNWRTALNTEESHGVSIAAVDENGKPVSRKVTVELYRVTSSWWWEGNGSSELTRYINRNSAELLQTKTFKVNNGKGIYDLKFPDRGWGKYLLRVTDPFSGHSSLEEFYGDYPGWYNQSEGGSEAASMLNLQSDKNSYTVGEEAKITIPSGGMGKIYITLEKGDQIIDQFWVDAKEGSTSISIPTTAEMAPNVYMTAFLIQPNGQTENSLPIRMYGVVPLNVSDPQTHLTPEIKAPKEVQPNSTFEVEVSEKEGKAMAYTLAVVDEGLLSLTRFKTPNPWSAFYSKEALMVKTWDMYKYVLSAQAGKMSALLAIGGDEGLVYKEDVKANRFKSVVTYMGPFYLDSKDSQKHTIQVPNYIGAVRVMVVGAYEGAYGSAESEVQVKKPLMVLSTLPRVLGPSEKVTIPVNVITMKDNLKKVKVVVTSNELLKSTNASTQTVSFNRAGEKTVYFDFEVPKKLGVAKFKVEVSSGSESAFEEVELLVRPSNPKVERSEFAVVENSQTWKHDYKSFGIKGTNSAVLQVSKIPDLNLEKHLGYLIRYPHGCIEQTTSSVFPQLYLSSLTELSDQQKEDIDRYITAALNKYRSFQNSTGGFSYWPGENGRASDWGTSYAGHFILEARNKGYEIPTGMLEAWVKFQKTEASNWRRSNFRGWRYGGDLSQAYRLYTLALSGNPDVGAMNRLKSDTALSNAASWRLAAAYAIMGREDASIELTKRPFVSQDYRDLGYGYGSGLRDRAMVLETMTYLDKRQTAGQLLQEIARDLGKGWHSTQTRSYALLAMGKFLGGSDASDAFAFTAQVNGVEVSVDSDLPIYRIEIDKDHLSSGSISIDNRSGKPLFATLVQTGIPTEDNAPSAEENLHMEVRYVDMKGNPLDPTMLFQGQDFKAVVTVRHPGMRNDYQEMALTQIFPSGWQIVNTRVSDDYEKAQGIEFQDIRDDRVYTYFDLGRGQGQTVEILLNATFPGSYYQPAVYCAPMYDESISSTVKGQWVEVIQ